MRHPCLLISGVWPFRYTGLPGLSEWRRILAQWNKGDTDSTENGDNLFGFENCKNVLIKHDPHLSWDIFFQVTICMHCCVLLVSLSFILNP